MLKKISKVLLVVLLLFVAIPLALFRLGLGKIVKNLVSRNSNFDPLERQNLINKARADVTSCSDGGCDDCDHDSDNECAGSGDYGGSGDDGGDGDGGDY